MGLAEDAIRPFYHRSWVFPRDPDFAQKASRVLDLYEGRWEGEPLGEREYVISADEKTSIQARSSRCHRTLPTTAKRTMRVEHEYERRGALAYTWPPGMSAAPGSLTAAKRKTGSSRLAVWSSRR